MNTFTEAQVQKVQKYSALARGLCSVLLVMLLVSSVLVVRLVFDPSAMGVEKITIGRYLLSASSADTISLKIWLLVMVATGVVISGAIIYLLRRVFDNMAHAMIFSADNVGHIRQIGWIIFAIGVLQLLAPAVDGALFAGGTLTISFPGALLPFLTAAFIYLVSWIMQVGLGVSTEAAELRRDAELVV